MATFFTEQVRVAFIKEEVSTGRNTALFFKTQAALFTKGVCFAHDFRLNMVFCPTFPLNMLYPKSFQVFINIPLLSFLGSFSFSFCLNMIIVHKKIVFR